MAVLVLSYGCAREAGGTASHAAGLEGLLAEARGLGSLFAPTHLLLLAVAVGGAVGLNALLGALLRLGWRFGLDNQRRWARRSALSRWLLAALAAAATLRSAFAVAPLLTTLATLTLLLGVLLLSGLIPNLFAAARLSLRRQIRVGDRVRVGQQEGVVREIGILQLRLTGMDGATILVPNRLLTDLPVLIDRARHSVPVRARVHLAQAPDAALLTRLRQVAALSPYRAPESLVDVARGPDDDQLVIVEIQVWSGRAQRDAKAQLEAAVRRAAEQLDLKVEE
jgi:small-conductance mechanosensitive channel